jgi:uncharacterized protein
MPSATHYQPIAARDVRFVCNGGCPKDRVLRTPDSDLGLNYLCQGYKAFFRHIDRPMRIMTELLQRRQAPANIMAMLAREEADLAARMRRSGRNELCSCGSGHMLKHCHGR